MVRAAAVLRWMGQIYEAKKAVRAKDCDDRSLGSINFVKQCCTVLIINYTIQGSSLTYIPVEPDALDPMLEVIQSIVQELYYSNEIMNASQLPTWEIVFANLGFPARSLVYVTDASWSLFDFGLVAQSPQYCYGVSAAVLCCISSGTLSVIKNDVLPALSHELQLNILLL